MLEPSNVWCRPTCPVMGNTACSEVGVWRWFGVYTNLVTYLPARRETQAVQMAIGASNQPCGHWLQSSTVVWDLRRSWTVTGAKGRQHVRRVLFIGWNESELPLDKSMKPNVWWVTNTPVLMCVSLGHQEVLIISYMQVTMRFPRRLTTNLNPGCKSPKGHLWF